MRASRNAYWRLVTSVEQFVKGLFIDYETGLAVPVGTLRQGVFNQDALSDDAIDAIDAVETAGHRNRHRARRMRQIADALPIDFIVVLRDLAALFGMQQFCEQALAVLAPIARVVFH